MKTIKFLAVALVAIIVSLPFAIGQLKFGAANAFVEIKGTSTLHDWEMKSSAGKCDATLNMTGEKLTGISNLSFLLAAETLKSGTSGLDKNGYKALDTKKNPSISFNMTSGTITAVDATTYQFKGMGNLTIGGTTRLTDLVATMKYSAAEKAFVVTGSKTIKMTDWKVTPPTVMFGTIKTGDKITIDFNLKIKA
ncbi:MAG TPA: YceI family protein [Chitinophagaceae bacterium]